MDNKRLLLVGLEENEPLGHFELPGNVEVSTAESVPEAVDSLLLTSPDLIVANHQIGPMDSLDFITSVMESIPENNAPVVFLGPPGTNPFVYEQQNEGVVVRYLDVDRTVHSHFVREWAGEREYAVRSFNADTLGDEILRLLSGNRDLPAISPSDADLESMIWEMGLNQDLTIEGTRYHIQTEVIDLRPLTVATTVFSAGRTVHGCEQRVSAGISDVEAARAGIGDAHAGIVRRLRTGELP